MQRHRQNPLQEGLENAVTLAGKLALDHFGKDIPIETKADGSKVSRADYAVNTLLEEKLRPLDPDIAWLSEESPKDPDRLTKPRIWIIDPIDGTSSFLNHDPDWTIVAALVENGEPVLAAIYNPVREELFTAEKGKGAALNGKPISTSETNDLGKARIITSKSHYNRTFKASEHGPERIWRCSMAYRIALVAAGMAEATLSLTPKNDWDIAAAHLLIEEAGGRISTPDGAKITYNKQQLTHKGVVAASNRLYTSLITLTKGATAPQNP